MLLLHKSNYLFFVLIYWEKVVGKCNVNNDLKVVKPFKALELIYLYYKVNGMTQFETPKTKSNIIKM